MRRCLENKPTNLSHKPRFGIKSPSNQQANFPGSGFLAGFGFTLYELPTTRTELRNQGALTSESVAFPNTVAALQQRRKPAAGMRWIARRQHDAPHQSGG